jgi:hypothetical protein
MGCHRRRVWALYLLCGRKQRDLHSCLATLRAAGGDVDLLGRRVGDFRWALIFGMCRRADGCKRRPPRRVARRERLL